MVDILALLTAVISLLDTILELVARGKRPKRGNRR